MNETWQDLNDLDFTDPKLCLVVRTAYYRGKYLEEENSKLKEALHNATEATHVYLSALAEGKLIEPDRFDKLTLCKHIEDQNKLVEAAFTEAPRWNFENEVYRKNE